MLTLLFFFALLTHTSCFPAAAAGAGAGAAKANCDLKSQASTTQPQAQDQKTLNNLLHRLPTDIVAKFLWDPKKDITKPYLSPIRNVFFVCDPNEKPKAFSRNYAIFGSFSDPTTDIFQRHNNGTWVHAFNIFIPEGQSLKSLANGAGLIPDQCPHKERVLAVDINDNYAICASRYGVVYIMNHNPNGTWSKVYELEGAYNPRTVKLDGARAIVGSATGTFILQRQPNGTWKSDRLSNNSHVAAIAGNFAMTASDNEPTITNLNNRQIVYQLLKKNRNFVLNIALSTDHAFVGLWDALRTTLTIETLKYQDNKWQPAGTIITAPRRDFPKVNLALAGNSAIIQVDSDPIQVTEYANGTWQAPYTVADSQERPIISDFFKSQYYGFVRHDQRPGNTYTITKNSLANPYEKVAVGDKVITFNPLLDQLSPDKALQLAQYNFIDDLEIARHLHPQGVIVLTDQQLKLFKTLPVQKRMALKKQHGLATADAIQKVRQTIAAKKPAGCTLM